MFRSLFIVVVALSISFSSHAFDFGEKIHEITLDNGMKWILLERDSVPVFSGLVFVKTGGVYEVPGKTGLAHMFEHMAFKGSPDFNGEDLWSAFWSNGAKSKDINAFTAEDITGFHASMPSVKFPLWAYLISEMIFRPILADFYSERNVVMEERRMRVEDSPDGFAMDKMTSLAFPDGPYHWSTIGEAEDIQSLTVEDAKKFHQEFYAPNNMVGVLVGAISPEKVKKVLETYFGRFPKGEPVAIPKPGTLPTQELRQTVTFKAEPKILIAIRKPTVPHLDDYIFDVLQELLCSGRTALLENALVKEKKILSDISCFNGYPGVTLDNLFLITASPLPNQELPKAEKAILEELEDLKSKVDEQGLKNVQLSVRSNFLWHLEDNMALAERLALYQAILGDWRELLRYEEKIAKITSEDVKRAAKEYFVPEKRVVLYRERKVDAK